LKSKTLCIDFDETIRSRLDDLPINGVAEVLSKLQKKGYRIVISSARINVKMWGELAHFRIDDIKNWLNKYHIPYDDVVAYKPAAALYIDDKGYRFEGDWEKTYNDVQKLLG
jgi:phosphoglycolate phosphatase-like HAD superfamily hydrolase